MKTNLKKRTIAYLIIAILFVLYGIKVALQGYGTLFFMIWIIAAVLLGIMAVGAQKNWWKKLPIWVRRGIAIIIAICLGIFIFVEGLIVSQIGAEGGDDLEYIIVLGAKVDESGPSSILKARLNAAIKSAEQNPEAKIIVSGGQGSNEPFSEAEGMRRYLVEKGIDEGRIILEPDSLNTNQNIINSKKIIGNNEARIGIVTSNFHVYRACKIAKKQGLKNVSGISGKVILLYMPQNMVREFFGIVKDKLAGNI